MGSRQIWPAKTGNAQISCVHAAAQAVPLAVLVFEVRLTYMWADIQFLQDRMSGKCVLNQMQARKRGDCAHLLHGSIAEMTVRPANFDLAFFPCLCGVFSLSGPIRQHNHSSRTAGQ